MNAPIEAQADALLWRVRQAASTLYALHAEAEKLGLRDCAQQVRAAEMSLNGAACTLHSDALGTDLTRLTDEQLAQGDETAVRA